MREKRHAAGRVVRLGPARAKAGEPPPGEFVARSWREAFERDPSAVAGLGFYLLPILELGRFLSWLAGWRPPGPRRPRRGDRQDSSTSP